MSDGVAATAAADPRVKHVLRAIQLNDHRPDALIQVLHQVQAMFGYLPMDLLKLVSKELNTPPSRVFGVVTFYHFFSLKPKGEHTCIVCTGTACYVKGAQAIVNQLEKALGIHTGETTADNKVGLEVARCVGACGLAPVVVLDNDIVAKATPQAVEAQVREKCGIPA